MLRALTETNSLTIRPLSVVCSNLECTNPPIFGGVTMALPSNLVQRTENNILSANTLIAGDGTNIVKDTSINVANDNMDLPANKSYKINGTTLLNHDGTNYNLDNVDNIRSGVDRNLNLDAQGNGLITLSTLANGGVKLQSSNTTNWALRATNSTDQKAVVIGTYGTIPAIGGHSSDMAAWNPLYFQPTNLSATTNSYVVFGDLAEATANNLDSKIISQGGIYSTRHITTEDQFRVNKTSNGYHAIGNNIVPTDIYQHQFQDSEGVLAHTNNLIFKNWSSPENIEGTVTTGTVIIDTTICKADMTFFSLECFTFINAGTTATLTVVDETTTETIASITIVGGSDFVYSNTTTFSNLPTQDTILSFNWNRTVGSGGAAIYGFILKALN